MPLILAIEPDKRQSTQLASLVKGLQAELLLRANAADALGALHGRVPDLVLTTSLISPRDDAALAAHLRELGSAAAHVQTVTIPLLGSAAPKRARGGMLAALRREKPQAPMTEGCEPDVFADQIRHYLLTAEEQQASAATRVVASAEPEAVAFEPEPVAFEPDAVEEAPIEEPFEEPFEDAIEEPAAVAEIDAVAETEWAAAPAAAEAVAEPLAETTVDPVVETVVEPEELVADEPAGLPLSQLLQMVSDAAPMIEAPLAAAELFDAPVAAPVVETEPIVEPTVELEPEPVTSFGDLYVDPMAAQALDELSRQAPMPSIADGVPAEPPVPVVEMYSFQSLDAIASELAAGPSQRRDSLDDLASLFAATPVSSAPAPLEATPAEPGRDFSAPMHGEKSLFASLFADPAPVRPSKPVEIPGIDPSLFASPGATPTSAFEEPVAVPAVEPEPEPQPELMLAAEPEPIVAVEPEPVAPAIPEPVFVAAAPEPVLATAPEPVFVPAIEEPVLVEAAPAEAAAVESTEDELIAFEPVAFEPVVEEPVEDTVAVAAAAALDEEIALDVDAFAFTAPEPAAPPAPAEPSRFSFTLVDGFGDGDAWSDFDVPSIASVAADLGLGEPPSLDPFAARPASAPPASRKALTEPQAAPSLDQEALSLIGDAARKVSLDAMVIEEFERSLTPPRPKKVKKKVHAGATQVPVPAAPEPKPAKRPVQDEWGMFDPEQCGFAALDEEEGSEPRPTTGTRVRVISY